MSANILFEMQLEIIKRVLQVKSLLRFRSVSTHWKSLIDSSKFITNHSVNKAQPHHLLIHYKLHSSDVKYVSIVDDDDDNFPLHKSSPVVPPTVNLVDHVLMSDSSHGLVCLYGYVDSNRKSSMIVIWNPSIRKHFGIKFSALSYGSTIGFGVCPKTSEPKIVRITRLHVDWKVEVFTLSVGAWRRISLNMHLPISTIFDNQQIVIDGVIHWVAHDFTRGPRDHVRIIRLDLISEEFGEVDLPDSLACGTVRIYKVNKSLVVIHFDNDNGEYKLPRDVWMMRKNGFEKLFSVGLQIFQTFSCHSFYGVVGFRKNGQPIREHPCGNYGSLGKSLEAYDPLTKHICDLGIHVDYTFPCFIITPYTESLLLLNNHSDYIIEE